MKCNSCDTCDRLVGESTCAKSRQTATFESDCPHYKPSSVGRKKALQPRPITFTDEEQEVVNRYLEGSRNGDKAMIWELVQLYWAHNYLQEAIDWCETIYRPGDAATAGTLASLYTSLREDAAAFRWTMQAYRDGDKAMAYVIAECYENGTGTERDEEQAIAWYLKAARYPDSDYEAILRLKELGVDAKRLQGVRHPELITEAESQVEAQKSSSSGHLLRNLLIAIGLLTALVLWYMAKNM